MKCPACFRWRPDDSPSCDHCGAGRQRQQPAPAPEAEQPRATPVKARAAIERMRGMLTRRGARDGLRWAREIVARRDRGERVHPFPLQCALEALGMSKASIEQQQVEAELAEKGVVQHDGTITRERQPGEE